MTFTWLSDAEDGFEFAIWGLRCRQLPVRIGGRSEVKIEANWVTCSEGQAYPTLALLGHHCRTGSGSRGQLAWITFDPPHDQTPLAGLDAATLVRVDAGRLWPVWQEVDTDLSKPWSVQDLGAVIGRL